MLEKLQKIHFSWKFTKFLQNLISAKNYAIFLIFAKICAKYVGFREIFRFCENF